ncbi:hypothetical protein [Actinoplanes couchii]|uniref:Tetratricopeptide repeat protein n=1 Tax=Actinoplanes couchii TaxID=403638 RepID=A0ABQ3XTG1_9ACTN|nr:hypothetical protein [Actinoplanes couchii]MDR6317028.1 hypothetical protein [Actinoplanes couchii]GID61725.1 hypothetical protein Aco03nite_101290 [Actinoplanes couchii]
MLIALRQDPEGGDPLDRITAAVGDPETLFETAVAEVPAGAPGHRSTAAAFVLCATPLHDDLKVAVLLYLGIVLFRSGRTGEAVETVRAILPLLRESGSGDLADRWSRDVTGLLPAEPALQALLEP